MASTCDAQDFWTHTFRQSWLKTTDICGQRALLEYTEDARMPRVDSDAASIGTAAHTAIETYIASEGISLTDMIEIWDHEFGKLVALPTFQWIKYSESQALAKGAAWLADWHREIGPTIPFDHEIDLEWGFEHTLYEDEDRQILLNGTIDYVDWTASHIIDWKTSGGGPYKAWEKTRWDIQSSVYTWAVAKTQVEIDPHGPLPTFAFVVMNDKEIQTLPVERNQLHWRWLTEKCEVLARQIEADLGVWPMNDNHALCSEKWCPAWFACKGATGITY